MGELLRQWRPLEDAQVDAKILLGYFATGRGVVAQPLGDYLGKIALASLDEWTAALRPFFTDPGQDRAAEEPSLLVREQLAPTPNSHTHRLAIWDNACSWRTQAAIRDSFAWCLERLPTGSIDKFEWAGRLVPFIVHISEDCELEHRLVGTRCIRQFLRATRPTIVLQMRLDALFRQTLHKNATSDSAQLREEALACLLQPPLINAERCDEQQIEWLEDLLDLGLREARFARDARLRTIHLKALSAIVAVLGVAVVCRVKALLALLLEMVPEGDADRDALLCLLSALLDHAWPRLKAHAVLLNEAVVHLEQHCRGGERDELLAGLMNRIGFL